MPDIVHLTPAAARRVPWKNGRGVTEEMAISPRDASFERGDFDWRVSKASIAESGPFSTFPGYDRVLVVTQGDGLILDHGGHAPRAEVPFMKPYGFSGDWPTTGELHDGAVADFNVLVRRGRFRVGVKPMTPGRRPQRAALVEGDSFVHVVAGPVIARLAADGRMFVLASNDGLCLRGARAGEALQVVATRDDCAALLVSLRPT